MEKTSSEIYINGEYLKNNPTWDIEDSPWKARIIFDIIKTNRIDVHEIIEVGCGAGGILNELAAKDDQFRSIKGYDISPQAIALAKRSENERVSFYNEDFLTSTQEKTDLILVIDVLEHVDNFYQFLRDLKGRSSYFIFHIPLDLCCRTLLKPHVLFQQRKAVGHIHYFSKEMVFWFLEDTAYKIIDWQYTKPVTDVNPADSFKRYVKTITRNLSYSFNKELSAKLWGSYSLMILAK